MVLKSVSPIFFLHTRKPRFPCHRIHYANFRADGYAKYFIVPCKSARREKKSLSRDSSALFTLLCPLLPPFSRFYYRRHGLITLIVDASRFPRVFASPREDDERYPWVFRKLVPGERSERHRPTIAFRRPWKHGVVPSRLFPVPFPFPYFSLSILLYSEDRGFSICLGKIVVQSIRVPSHDSFYFEENSVSGSSIDITPNTRWSSQLSCAHGTESNMYTDGQWEIKMLGLKRSPHTS